MKVRSCLASNPHLWRMREGDYATGDSPWESPASRAVQKNS
ncbi:hypothetical protein CSE45_1517 [Citreicella sp. SE45]|nr:hypothetical protein CSE45_1517 [Citreicella sp. SE45]